MSTAKTISLDTDKDSIKDPWARGRRERMDFITEGLLAGKTLSEIANELGLSQSNIYVFTRRHLPELMVNAAANRNAFLSQSMKRHHANMRLSKSQ